MTTAPVFERPLRRLGFIHIVPFTRDDPGRGLQESIELFRYADELGLDSGSVRTRHLQYGLPSSQVFLGALSQVTERIRLGNAVIPVEFENPFRLAEDLATADQLTGGRLEPGLSVHPPRYDDAVNSVVFDAGWRGEDYGYNRIERLRGLLRGAKVRDVQPYDGIGGDIDSERVEPFSPGLADRLWYGGGSLRSAEWAGRNGYGWLVSNISTSEEGITDFASAQRNQIDRYRSAHHDGDAAVVALGRTLAPTEGATAGQRSKFREYAERRAPRTKTVQRRNTIIALDLVGTMDEIVSRLASDAAVQAADDLLFELPFEFGLDDWKHILHQLAKRIGPALGWKPGRSLSEHAGFRREVPAHVQ